MLTTKVEEMDALKVENSNLKLRLAKLENLMDDEDAYVRRECLILSGPAVPLVSQGENCGIIARKLISDKLRLQIEANDISTAHRLGKKPVVQGPDRRSIIVQFCRRDTKRTIRMTKFDNRDENSKLFISESLTPKRRTILFALRQIKRNSEVVTGCSTMDGRVYAYTKNPASAVQTSPHDRKHLVNTHEALVEFCREFVKEPLDSFLETWTH